MAPESITGYTKILLDEVMPAVERSYNVSRNREERAIAGLSMGDETLYTALNHLDRFAWIGSFSGAFVMWPGANATVPLARRVRHGSGAGRHLLLPEQGRQGRLRQALAAAPRRGGAHDRSRRVRQELPDARRQGQFQDQDAVDHLCTADCC